MTTTPLRQFLGSIRSRRSRQQVSDCIVAGALAGSVVSCAILLAAYYWPFEPAALWALASLGIGIAAGAALGYWRRDGWYAAARLVDERCALEGRSTAALEFSTLEHPSTVHLLQLRDAESRLREVDPQQVVPGRWPRWIGPALLGVVATLVLLAFLPATTPPVRAETPETPEAILREADKLDEYAAKLEERAKELQSNELAELARLYREAAEALRKPGTDHRTALALLAKLQAEVSKLQQEFDPRAAQEELTQAGKAMQQTPELKDTGRALEKGQLQSAAENLDKQKQPNQDANSKETAAKLQESASKMDQKSGEQKGAGQKSMKQLGDATKKFADGLSGQKEQFDAGKRDLARELREQERRKRLSIIIAQEERRLAECKSQCESQARNLMQSRIQKNNPSQNASKVGAGNSPGQHGPGKGPDAKANGKNRLELTDRTKNDRGSNTVPDDQKGDGPPTSGSGDENDPQLQAGNRERQRRLTPEQQQRIRKQLDAQEAALDNESIPLSYRLFIRRYFQVIREQPLHQP